MPLNLSYTMVQKSQKWPKTQIKGGGPALKMYLAESCDLEFSRTRPDVRCWILFFSHVLLLSIITMIKPNG